MLPSEEHADSSILTREEGITSGTHRVTIAERTAGLAMTASDGDEGVRGAPRFAAAT